MKLSTLGSTATIHDWERAFEVPDQLLGTPSLPSDIRRITVQTLLLLGLSVILRRIFMAVLRSRCGHYMFALWFLSFFFLFFPRLISGAGDWMSTILPHMVWP